jgi:hypothetical protein
MVHPDAIPRILLDAARLIGQGELVVFCSAALAFWLDDPPSTRDVDLWCDPPERGHAVEALMGELSWYHERHQAYVEVWAPETFAAPEDWRERARQPTEASVPAVRLVVPHPHDVLFAKLERWEEADRDHAVRILAAFPLRADRAAALDARMPHRGGRITDPHRQAAYAAHFRRLCAMLPPEAPG